MFSSPTVLALRSEQPADIVLDALRSGLGRPGWLPTAGQWKRAALGTAALEAVGYVDDDRVQVWLTRPGERAPLLRPTLTGRVTSAEEGSVFTGALETRVPGAPVLVGFVGIVGLALIAGLIGFADDAIHSRAAAATHWLPAVIFPAVMFAFVAILVAVSRVQARSRAASLAEWLATKLG